MKVFSIFWHCVHFVLKIASTRKQNVKKEFPCFLHVFPLSVISCTMAFTVALLSMTDPATFCTFQMFAPHIKFSALLQHFLRPICTFWPLYEYHLTYQLLFLSFSTALLSTISSFYFYFLKSHHIWVFHKLQCTKVQCSEMYKKSFWTLLLSSPHKKHVCALLSRAVRCEIAAATLPRVSVRGTGMFCAHFLFVHLNTAGRQLVKLTKYPKIYIYFFFLAG